METLQGIIAHPIVRGAFSGFVAAAVVDIGAFRSWKSFDEAKSYAWGLASWRWFQGAVLGALAAVGLEGVS